MCPNHLSRHFKSFRLQNTSIGVNTPLDGAECIATGSNCLGDNHDTNYIHSTRQPLAASDAFVFVGTNCVQNSKCTYSNVGFYKGKLTSTPLSIDDRKFNGSASYYAPSLSAVDAARFFAFAVARDCGANPFCLTLNTDVVPLSENWFAIYRTYLEPKTKTGPLVSELVLPKLMHFSTV